MLYVSISKYNLAHGLPPIRVQRHINDTDPIYCNEVRITKPCRLWYDPNIAIKVFGVHIPIEVEEGGVEIIR